MGMSTATTVLYAMFARTQEGKGEIQPSGNFILCYCFSIHFFLCHCPAMALKAYITQYQGVEAAQTTGSPDLCRQQSSWHGIPLHLPHSIPKELQTTA